jgi:type II secretory pathway pseudopilin PulG
MKTIKAYLNRMYSEGFTERGDTIIEVLFALAVLGAVLSSSYVVVSRNITANRISQERLEAVKIAESQMEKLQIRATSDPGVFTSNNFCMTNIGVIGNSNQCQVNAAGDPTSEYPRYIIDITKDDDLSDPSGVRFKISLSWENARGTATDTIDYFYEVYR